METIDNGRRATADFPFYTGPVGVREWNGRTTVAYFGPTPRVSVPIDGKIDGARVRVLSIESRDLHQTTTSPARPDAVRVVTLAIAYR